MRDEPVRGGEQNIGKYARIGVVGKSVGAKKQIAAFPRRERCAEKVYVQLFGNADGAGDHVLARTGLGFFFGELAVVDQILNEGVVFRYESGSFFVYDIKAAVADIDRVEISVLNDNGNESGSHALIFFVFLRKAKDRRVCFRRGAD